MPHRRVPSTDTRTPPSQPPPTLPPIAPPPIIVIPPTVDDPPPLPDFPDWVPPVDTGLPSSTEVNQLERISNGTFAANNTAIPIVYGRERLFGQPFVIHVQGKFLYVAYGFCEGVIDSYEKILIDGIDVNDGDEGFLLNSGAKVTSYIGTATQTVDGDLSTAVPNYNDPNPFLAYVVVKAPQDSTSGFPKVEAIIKGLKVYDPRLDSTQTTLVPAGSGSHRANDSTTWAYSDNPALAFADFATQQVGWPIAWQGVVDVANDADTMIGGEKRRELGLALVRPSKAEQWTKAWRIYMSAFIAWEGNELRLIPDKKDVIGQGAAVFDGSAGTEINIGDEAILDFDASTTFTLEASVNPIALEDDKVVVGKKNILGGTDAGYNIHTRADGEIRVEVADGTTLVQANFPTVLTVDKWVTLTATIDRGGDEIRLSVDGVPHASNPVDISAVTGSLTNSIDFIIGNDGNSGNTINGLVDEVRVWQDFRSADEILANWDLELCLPDQQTDLVGYWRLNDFAGQTAIDHSVENNDGTLLVAATFGVGRLEIVPDGIAMHITSDDIREGTFTLNKRGLQESPNSVVVEYRDGTDPDDWRTLREQVETQAVIAGVDVRRRSRISLPGVKRASQARREAIARLNWFLSDLEGRFTLFDEGLQLQTGSIVAVTHPLGLTVKLFRVIKLTGLSGRWTVDISEYDQNQYSDEVIASPTLPDTQLGNPLIAPDVINLTAAEELFEYKNGNTGSRIRASWDAATDPFVSQYVVEGFVKGVRVFQTVTVNTEVVTSPVEELITSTTPVDYDIRVAAQTAFTIGTFATFEVTVQGKLAIPGDVPQVTGIQIAADQVALTWQAATDIDIWRYEVRTGDPVTNNTWELATLTELVDGLNYTVTGLATGTHRFFVKAIDSVRNESALAATVDKTLATPNPVDDLSGFEVASEVRLSWTAPTGFIARYRIAFSDIPETFETTLDVVDTLRFQTKDVPEGTFTFKVFAQDGAGNEAAADTIEIEVTSDADAFIADTHVFISPTLNNMTVWQTREFPNDGKKFYTTDMGEVFDSGPAPHDFVAGTPVATYHTAGASSWTSETHDFGLLLTGSWNFQTDITALSGIFATTFELSPDNVNFDIFTGPTKGTYRYARMKIETSATPGTATVFVIAPPTGVSVTVVPLEESGASTSLSSGGDKIVLSKEYIALKEITTQAINTNDGLTSVVDNIIIGPNTGVQSDGTNYLDGGDIVELDFGASQDFSIEGWVKHGGGTGIKRLVGKRNGTAEGWQVDLDETNFELSVTIEDTSANTVTHTTAGDGIPNDGSWYHFGVVVDRGADIIAIHIDGVVNNGSASISAVTATLETTAAFRCCANSAAGEVFTGVLDEVRIWNDVRTAAEFLNNKDIEISPTSTNLVGYWHMDGKVSASVVTVQDEHVNNNDLTDTGAGDMLYIDPGIAGNIIEKVNSFDVYIFDTFGTQVANDYQWKWKAV